MLLSLLCLLNLLGREAHSITSIAAIGPDVYGFLPEYRDALEQASVSNDGVIRVGEYFQNEQRMKHMEDRILAKYKEVRAILVSTSLYYYNYRHAGNVFSLGSSLRKLGLVSRHNVLSFVSEPCLCHPSNSFPGRMYVTKSVDVSGYSSSIAQDTNNIYTEDMYTQYRSLCLRSHHLRYIMTQRFPKKYPLSSRIATRYRVEIDGVGQQVDLPTQLIYMTGHGGDSYFQFQAKDILSAKEVEVYMSEFHVKNPNMHTLFITDTCQASTMLEKLSPNVPLAWMASSPRGISSYSYNSNMQLTVSVVGKFTFYVVEFIHSVINGIKERRDRASVSRFSMWQLQRHLVRHCSEEFPVFYTNSCLTRDEDGTQDDKSMKRKEAKGNENNGDQDIKKLYLGSFIINYRIAEFNEYQWPLDSDIKQRIKQTLPVITYRDFGIDNEKFTAIEFESLKTRMKRSGLLNHKVKGPPEWIYTATYAFFGVSLILVIVQYSITEGFISPLPAMCSTGAPCGSYYTAINTHS